MDRFFKLPRGDVVVHSPPTCPDHVTELSGPGISRGVTYSSITVGAKMTCVHSFLRRIIFWWSPTNVVFYSVVIVCQKDLHGKSPSFGD